MKKVLLSLSLLCAFLFTQSYALTIVTFNIANYNDHKPWPERLELLVNEIKNTDADIVVLQEVRLDPDEATTKLSYQNSAEQILYRLNQQGAFIGASLVSQPAMYYPFIDNHSGHNYPLPAQLNPEKKAYVWEGLSIISKKKIISTGSFMLSQPASCTDPNTRITQYAKIATDLQPIYIANTHFGLAGACVENNINETLAGLSELTTKAPILILGDFNVTPDDPVLRTFTQNKYTDVWQYLMPFQKGYTYPANSPLKRIDYIWANPAMLKYIRPAGRVWQIGGTSQNGIHPSDHLGLVLQL